MSGRVAALLCILSVTAACGATRPSVARRAAEQQFSDNVHETATDIGRYRTRDQLVKLGYAVCDGFRANAGIEQIAGLLERTGARNLPPEDLGAVISVAVKDLCPVYRGRLNPLQGG